MRRAVRALCRARPSHSSKADGSADASLKCRATRQSIFWARWRAAATDKDFVDYVVEQANLDDALTYKKGSSHARAERL